MVAADGYTYKRRASHPMSLMNIHHAPPPPPTYTQEPFVDPVVAADGHTYERRAITDWLECHDISPVTDAPLEHKLLVPNALAKALVHDFM